MRNKGFQMRNEYGVQNNLRTNNSFEREMNIGVKANKVNYSRLCFILVMMFILILSMMMSTANAATCNNCESSRHLNCGYKQYVKGANDLHGILCCCNAHSFGSETHTKGYRHNGDQHETYCTKNCGYSSKATRVTGNVTTQPTCTTKGVRTYTCDVGGCSYSRTESIAAIGHNYTWLTGYHTKRCSNCGKEVNHLENGYKYYTASLELCSAISGCKVTRAHSLGSWQGDNTQHWKLCTNSGCAGKTFSKGSHVVENPATCTTKATCATCKLSFGPTLGHNMVPATCTEPSKCTRCGITSGSALGHVWGWEDYIHVSRCERCGETVRHDAKFVYFDQNTEKCDFGECRVTREHTILAEWQNDDANHWKVCANSGCAGYTFVKSAHSLGTEATCTKKAICGVCHVAYGSAKGHNFIACSKQHCIGTVCSRCGLHDGTCGGGCNSVYCDHCKVTYCNKTTKNVCGHTCVHNNDGRCNKEHCVGMTWCTLCNNHVCATCNTAGVCQEPHCSKAVCSICKGNHQGECGGGHKYRWETNDNGEVQTHTNKCYVTNDCTAINGTHTSNWGSADSNHTSTCIDCTLKYTHEPQWKVLSESDALIHPCAWPKGCDATHTPVWGVYYKKNGGQNGDSDGGPHTRKCQVCNSTEKSHSFSTEAWTWLDNNNHKRTCDVCGLIQAISHNFGCVKKDVDDVNHSELYKHWNVCVECEPDKREADEEHTDNGYGVCSKCDQLLWKAISEADENITEYVTDEDKSRELEAKQSQKIKIVEVVDSNGNPKIQYIQNLTGIDNLTASNDIFTIIKNGEYNFQTGRGGIATLIISNVSRELLIDKIVDPMTATTERVTIILRPNSAEESFKKKICIVQGIVEISDADVAAKQWNSYEPFKVSVTQNGTYYFTAKDSAGNSRVIKVVVDNIIKGQATVAVVNDVFVNGYLFTDILVNPNKPWHLNGNKISARIQADAYKSNDSKTLSDENIKFINVMDMLGNVVTPDNSGIYPSGSYYIHVALGGSIFSTEGTYIIDLKDVILNGALDGEGKIVGGDTLDGKNRIVVDVQQLKDLT